MVGIAGTGGREPGTGGGGMEGGGVRGGSLAGGKKPFLDERQLAYVVTTNLSGFIQSPGGLHGSELCPKLCDQLILSVFILANGI